MTLCRKHTLATVLASLGILLAAGSSAQDPAWRELAAREAQRVAEATRAESIRRQYERRRSAAHARMRSEQDNSSLFASTLSASESQLSCPALPVAGMRNLLEGIFTERSDGTLLIDIGNQASTGIGSRVARAPPPWWPDRLTPLVQPAASGPDFAAAHEDLLAPPAGDAQPDPAGGTAHTIPLLPSASDANGRVGITQVRNRSARAAEVRVVAVDDSGREYGPLRLFIEANGRVEVDSDDLENGNPDKSLYGGTGPGVGDWRLELSSDAQIEALSFVRTWDGALMPMHDVVASEGTRHRVPIFHPASQWEQESRLRLINPGDAPADVSIAGIDSHGNIPGTGVSVTIPAGASVTYTAAELESGLGAGLSGSLGEGAGPWWLMVDSAQPMQVMNLLSSPTGHLSNLSTAPFNETPGVHGVPLLPGVSDPSGRAGLVRVINHTDTAGEVHIKAFDDTQWDYAPLVLLLGAGEAVQFDSNDLEQGNPDRGLTGGTGPGEGDWRLELSSDLDIGVLSYVRSWDGLLTAMHDIVPGEATRYRVASFDAQTDPEQESRLRLINPGSTPAQVMISGTDSLDASPGREVSVTIPAGVARTYTGAELVSGEGVGLAGSLGEAMDRRQLLIDSEQPLQVMSLLSGPAGRLTNMSTGPVHGVAIPSPIVATDSHGSGAETIEDVFGSDVSPIVQAKCVLCHVQGGASGFTRLVFVSASNADHEALNLQAFRDFLEEVDDGANVILNKVQGVAHGGGVQTAAGTQDYVNLQRFLGLLGEAVSPISITPETLFDGVTMETPRQTLRRAALVFAGRIPTEAEYAAIRGGSEEALRATIRGLMTGPGFHEFLIRASNDRLFTDRDRTIIDNNGSGYGFVAFLRKIYGLNQREGSIEAADRYIAQAQYGFRRAPLELIAHVTENDLPYTEILTANYVMANPMAAAAYGAATAFENPDDLHEFKPSRIATYYRPCEGIEVEQREFGDFVVDPGPCSTDYPHAGILNTKVFLQRYPTTATNRNRARSRWTYYHFLGLDIEKSASRTTDPVALADTNNPTMNNPACTVCHTVLDPVAGAFQNYGDDGLYRDQGGLDALDPFYKRDFDAGSGEFEVTARSHESRQTLTVEVVLPAGQSVVRLVPRFDLEGREGWWNGGFGEVRVLDRSGVVVHRVDLAELHGVQRPGSGEQWLCGKVREQSTLRFFESHYCPQEFPIELDTAGSYTVNVEVWVYADENVGERRRILSMQVGTYQEGDTWYRDMRNPGFDGQLAPNPHNSLQWLAQRIVADERFAEAAVKFWWPPIMGAEVAEPPEDEADTDFAGLLLASNAQAAEVTRLANGFRSGFHEGSPYNLKDLLVEIVLSRWFRADSVSENNEVRAAALRGVGAKRLLTPEELARKTLALTGFQRGRSREPEIPSRHGVNHLTDAIYGVRLLYGGIDSDGITERARDLTSVMAGVAQSHALQSSYPIVMRELYLLPEEDRLLFAGIETNLSPVTEFSSTFEIAAGSRSDIETLRLTGYLNAGAINISLTFLNDYWNEDLGDRNLRLDRLMVRDSEGDVIVSRELEDLERITECNQPVGEHFALHCPGSLAVPLEIPSDGIYAIEVLAWADQAGDELVRLGVNVQSDSERSVGANRIRAKLVELYDKLHGIQVTADSPEVRYAYELFVDVWERKRQAYGEYDSSLHWNEEDIAINWASDPYYFDGIADHLWREQLNEDRWPLGWDWDGVGEFFSTVDWSDPHAVARTWPVVLAYLMMDYRYLYL